MANPNPACKSPKVSDALDPKMMTPKIANAAVKTMETDKRLVVYYDDRTTVNHQVRFL